MERKYFFASTVGRPQDVLQRIIAVVVNSNTASQIPLVKLERNARRQFYVFLGVDSDETSRIPGGLGQTFRLLGITFNEDSPLKPDQIRSMVQRQDIEIHGFNSLRYRSQTYEDPGDPFEQSDAWQPQEASPEVCARFECLLHWLSARGEGTWEAFKQAGDILGVSGDRQEARSALRRLSLLGHIDLSGDGSRWSISPGALVRFPDGPESGFLAGQRTGSLLRNVGELWPLNETQQTHYSGPPRIYLDSGVPPGADCVATLGISDAGVTSTRLADLLPGLEEWKDSLQSVPNLSTGVYDIEKWYEGDFQTCDTVYDRDGVYYGEPGMYRLSLNGNRSGRSLTVFFDEQAQRWLRGDWYGLRFLALEARENGVSAVHDSNAGELLIPASQRWPLLYERALTLASGLLPGRAANPDWLSYPRIPLDLARTLCGKLNVTLLEE